MRYNTRPIQSPFSRNQLQYQRNSQQTPASLPHPSNPPTQQAPTRTQVKKFIGNYEFFITGYNWLRL